MNNIYIQTLKLGFENPNGISFNEVVEKLNIDLSDKYFKISFTIWFYDNFYNYLVEQSYPNEVGHLALTFTFKNNMDYHTSKSYLKGDAVNKYIDYLELERTRKSAIQASWFATGSILIAILAVFFPYIFKPNPAITLDVSVLFSIVLVIASVFYTFFRNREKEPHEMNKTFWLYAIIITVLGVISAILLVYLFTVLGSSLLAKILGVVAILVFIVGQILRKSKS